MSYSYQYISQSPYVIGKPGDVLDAWVKIKNTGTTPWQSQGANAVKLGTSNAQDRDSIFATPTSNGWLTNERVAMTKNVTTDATGNFSVQQNQEALFEFKFTIPSTLPNNNFGTYAEYFDPVVEGIQWMSNNNIFWNVTVPAPIGICFFTWYGANGQNWTPTLSSGSNTDNVKETLRVRDYPYLNNTLQGWYDSADEDIQREQLDQIEAMGIDFVALDWWDLHPLGATQSTRIRTNTKAVADLIIAEYPNLKFCFLLEPENGSSSTALSQDTYDDIFDTYGGEAQFFKKDGKPVVFLFLPLSTKGDTRFNEIRITGGTDANTIHWWANPPAIKNRMVTLNSSFSNLDHCVPAGRTCVSTDVGWSGSTFNTQRDNAMAARGALDLVLLYGWNEYYERASIEPHYRTDCSSGTGNTFMKDLWTQFVTNWKTVA